MPLIEGLGDEVTLFMGLILLCIVISFAWFSTQTADLPQLRQVGITVIERTQIRRRVPHDPLREGAYSPIAVGDVNLPVNFPASSQAYRRTIAAAVRASREREAEEEARRSNTTEQTSNDVPVEAVVTEVTLSGACGEISDVKSESVPLMKSDRGDAVGDSASNVPVVENIPAADIVVEGERSMSDILRSDLPADEEVRRRRVQYFHNIPDSTIPAATNQEIADDNTCAASNNLSKDTVTQEARENNGSIKSESQSLNANSSVLNASALPGDTGDNTSSQEQQSPHPINQHNTITDARVGSSQSSEGASPTVTLPESQSWPENSRMTVKLKYMDQTQRQVRASPMDTIGDFRRTHFQQELEGDSKWVRFIFQGQDLRDDSATLQDYRVADNCTMHCLVTDKVRSPASPAGGGPGVGGRGMAGRGVEDEEDSAIGTLMYPLFTLLLLVVWYFRFTYRQYFSPMSTVCLIGISFLLGLGYFSSLRTATGATTDNNNTPPTAATASTARSNNPNATTTGHVHAD